MSMESWFVFKSYNKQHIYGWGTENEAVDYESRLNESPYYWALYPVSEAKVKELKLNDNDLGISLSVALQDIEETS